MTVTEALASRISVRDFLPEPVPETLLRDILAKAARAPSGGNLQPWFVTVLTGEPLKALIARTSARALEAPKGESSEYNVYPSPLEEPYYGRRFRVGEDMYRLLGIPREDKAARRAWFGNNFRFFGAPVGMFCFVDRGMGAAQWSDLGMFLQSVMLLLREAGYDSCAQEFWAMFAATVYAELNVPENLMLFCGMAIGKRNPDAAVNQLVSERAGVDEFASFKGFPGRAGL
ncbi:MAG TPA: nitroreductase [Acidocella sp.]|nr:MAG: nitroreductase family protein [Acidocella sp. 20-58-15]HQT38273.1 nitroreductase [Acidocella sp.]